MSAALRGRKKSPETIERIRQASRRVAQTPKAKAWFDLHLRGRKHTQGEKEKIGQALQGRKHSSEARLRMSEVARKRPPKARLLNSLGVIRYWARKLQGKPRKYQEKPIQGWGSPGYVAWRRKVFIRDNHTCQNCKKRGVEIEAHHVKSWARHPELRYEVSNGITLCRIPCHVEANRLQRTQEKEIA